MLSVVMPVRGTPDMAAAALASMRVTLQALDTDGAEVLLLDDASEEPEVLEVLRAGARSIREGGHGARVWRARERQYYLNALSFGTQQACGSRVLWWECDQIANPYCWQELLDRIEDPGAWAVRCSASMVDGAQPGAQVPAPLGATTYLQAEAFARYVLECRRGEVVDANPMSTDGVILRRETIDRLGVMDNRFGNYFSEWDYWARALRAGGSYRLALGAWCYHEGAIHVKGEAMRDGGTEEAFRAAYARRMVLVERDYQKFLDKWSLREVMPEHYSFDIGADVVIGCFRAAVANPGPAQHEWPDLTSKWERVL